MRMKSKRPDEAESTDRAVSPVIGVILMVAITVILAAVIAAFVLDISPGGEPAPNANLEVTNENADDDEITIGHEGGDSISGDDLTIVAYADGSVEAEATVGDNIQGGESSEMTTGDTFTASNDGGDDDTEIEEIRVIHDPSDTTLIDHDPDDGFELGDDGWDIEEP